MTRPRADLKEVIATALDELAGAIQVLEVCEYAVIGYSHMTTGDPDYGIAALIEGGVEKLRVQEQALTKLLCESRSP